MQFSSAADYVASVRPKYLPEQTTVEYILPYVLPLMWETVLYPHKLTSKIDIYVFWLEMPRQKIVDWVVAGVSWI
jgi:hypothetical protein